MKRKAGLGVLVVVFFSFLLAAARARAQGDRIVIPAGTPEDHDLQSISNEQDTAKRLAMYQDFVQKYASNPAAVAYGNWQLAQAYQSSGDLNKALEYGDKALAGAPRNLDILVLEASIAQQAKDNTKLMGYAAKGGEVCHSLGKQAKPEGMSDDDFSRQVEEDESAAKNACNFLESAGFNAIASETDAKLRMADIEKFSAAFPDSGFQDQVSNYAIYTLGPGQLNDQARLFAYGEKTLAANPNSLPALLQLAGSYVDDAKPGSVGEGGDLRAKSDCGRKGGCGRCGQVAQDFGGRGPFDSGIRLHQARQNGGGASGIAGGRGTAEGARRSAIRHRALSFGFCLRQAQPGERSARGVDRGGEDSRSGAGHVARPAQQGECGAGESEVTLDHGFNNSSESK
jgi:tetratricopeptide (TPR) repeat protein